MKPIYVLVVGIGALLAYFFSRKTAVAPQGGAYSGADPNIHVTNSPGQMWAADQSNGQLAGVQQRLPIWNPTEAPPISLIGTPGNKAGTPSGSTYPDPEPTSYVAPTHLDTVGLSPTFWAADKVPTNPYLDGGLGGPNYTD